MLDAIRAPQTAAAPDVTDTLSAEFDAVIRVLAFGHRKHADRLAESGYGDAVEHASHAQGHLTSAACLRRDAETGESHYIHAAARCLLAAHCEARTAAHPLQSAPEGEVPD